MKAFKHLTATKDREQNEPHPSQLCVPPPLALPRPICILHLGKGRYVPNVTSKQGTVKLKSSQQQKANINFQCSRNNPFISVVLNHIPRFPHSFTARLCLAVPWKLATTAKLIARNNETDRKPLKINKQGREHRNLCSSFSERCEVVLTGIKKTNYFPSQIHFLKFIATLLARQKSTKGSANIHQF